ncbi:MULTISPECIES: RDD family protein [unclassified Mycobacterium]|uniref:RDD family protein n=1 Tax=unclassified Mycobacterium TaxID=2642494 RepID=UPI002740779E|nr:MULTISPECIES: RDD family protein [unclassified Mycobacterium]MDP7704474.1 RDD family protein [Mycobacterium sp. TY815]MDP7722944.1 RDD family protein [Mycobacterium sp. TY814]
MTVVVEKTRTAAQDLPEKALAPWHVRVAAFSIDVLAGLAVATTMALVSFTLPPYRAWWWVCMVVCALAVLAVLVNRLLLPTVTGWSLGRAQFGIAVARRDGTDVSPWWLLLRDLAHLLDTAALLVGWFWPLWDSQRRTFADMLLRTEVLRVVPPEQADKVRKWTAAALVTAAVLCVGGAGVGYGVVYYRAQAADRTRAEISTQGPKIVAQMLTYDPKNLHDDFARALNLTTDRYRKSLAAQQEVVEKGHPVINEYWGSTNSVLEATPYSATMLLFLQGRRGEGQETRYITASVRVKFIKSGDGRWLVDDLTVLAKPKPAGEGK